MGLRKPLAHDITKNKVISIRLPSFVTIVNMETTIEWKCS
jgi:hypothetical protein